jgi:transposase InsO family protein
VCHHHLVSWDLVPSILYSRCSIHKSLHSDGGGEYIAKHIQEFLEERSVTHEITTANMLQHNGVVERLNRTLLDKTQAMLLDANLPKSYWLEALNYAVHLHNVLLSKALATMPTKAYSGTKLDISRL